MLWNFFILLSDPVQLAFKSDYNKEYFHRKKTVVDDKAKIIK